jgi:hypothetical protein
MSIFKNVDLMGLPKKGWQEWWSSTYFLIVILFT